MSADDDELQRHLDAAEDFVREVAADQGMDEDEVAWDAVTAYVDAELGRDSELGREVLRVKLGLAR